MQPRVDPALDAIVLGALERDLDRRTESARELGQALSAYVARSGERAGLAELAEWMRSIFAAERTFKLELLDRARRVPPSSGDERDPRTTVDRPLHRREATHTVTGPTPETSGERTAPSGAPAHQEDPTVATPSQSDEFDEPSTIALSGVAPSEAGAATPAAPSGGRAALPLALLALGGVAVVVLLVVTVAIVAALSLGDDDAEVERVEPAAVELPAGVVHVATRGGWADVHYGGRRVGRTPHELTLPAGEHDLVLYPEGREPARRLRVTVVPGRTERVLVDLGP
ncbi:MAG: PEGA domain-containing protein [Sandaracinaceae bacterium]|nr:PEGA domain-containing protein [Sandaracinaceae bacterium]